MANLYIRPFFGFKDDKMSVLDLHCDPIDCGEFYPRIIPPILDKENKDG